MNEIKQKLMDEVVRWGVNGVSRHHAVKKVNDDVVFIDEGGYEKRNKEYMVTLQEWERYQRGSKLVYDRLDRWQTQINTDMSPRELKDAPDWEYAFIDQYKRIQFTNDLSVIEHHPYISVRRFHTLLRQPVHVKIDITTDSEAIEKWFDENKHLLSEQIAVKPQTVEFYDLPVSELVNISVMLINKGFNVQANVNADGFWTIRATK